MGGILEALTLVASFIGYIITQGAFFGERFRNNKFVIAILVAIMGISFLFLIDDIAGFFSKKSIEMPKPLSSAGEYYMRGREFEQKGDYVRAYNDYDSALIQDPKYCDAIYAKSVIDQKAKKIEAAISGFEETLKCNPSHKSAEIDLHNTEDMKLETTLQPLWTEISVR